ncbi:VCBS repeat-containing protein [Chitinophaga nivalis]|uniref:VCBS repeat-containing protein n=1 Tax=Chitinophaga nivalis TaxID=2991709 RepID=A0ABT3ITD2_9BACT|nr:VCBS repeat-containing protein [Chitinophaga nivalis]MCW3463073.1 VCBS repeat-containing protein [Chitinophaga nivalis]MCW3487237.1 VCBS repeat-containing protein [Chitinophaga nivalis]
MRKAIYIGLVIIVGCQLREKEEKGKVLADKYCSGCHLPVAPALLDKETWIKHVLPAMAPRLGIHVWGEYQYYPPMPGEPQGLITFNDWTTLVEYYQRQAPERLTPAKPPVALQHDSSFFSIIRPVVKDSAVVAATTLVSFHPGSSDIFTSDGNDNSLIRWNMAGQSLYKRRLPSPATDILYLPDQPGQAPQAILTEIGNVRALESPAGIVTRINLADTSRQQDLMPFLRRPVQTLAADFDRDGLTDLLVCAFGHNRGGLYWLKQLPGQQYRQETIAEVPGAIHAETGDFNQDGYTDIMVLFAAGDEGIWLYENNRKGGFTGANILRFPPLYGSTGFQLTDINQDGKPDILYTCGDNADYSTILKPYHGIYIYLNEGNHKYRQAWFYPVNGCTKAVAADFNQDGKMDIASIAFFADLKNNPGEKFILFEGDDRPLSFTPHALPIEKEGHWICMDVKDQDQDGDLDIILGNYAAGFIILQDYQPDWKEYQPFIVLRNNTRRQR